MRSYYVYMMANRSGTLYTGVTNDLQRRAWEHRQGLGAFTAKCRLVKLVYYEIADDPYGAISREKEIRVGRAGRSWLSSGSRIAR